jgi:hypothetical protein
LAASRTTRCQCTATLFVDCVLFVGNTEITLRFPRNFRIAGYTSKTPPISANLFATESWTHYPLTGNFSGSSGSRVRGKEHRRRYGTGVVYLPECF